MFSARQYYLCLGVGLILYLDLSFRFKGSKYFVFFIFFFINFLLSFLPSSNEGVAGKPKIQTLDSLPGKILHLYSGVNISRVHFPNGQGICVEARAN